MKLNEEQIEALDAVNFPKELRGSIFRFYSEEDIMTLAFKTKSTTRNFFEAKGSHTQSNFVGDWAFCGDMVFKKTNCGAYAWYDSNAKDFLEKRGVSVPHHPCGVRFQTVSDAYMHLRGAVVVRMDGGEHGHYLIPLVESIVGRKAEFGPREFGIGYRVGKGLLWEELKKHYGEVKYIYNSYWDIMDKPVEKEWGDVAVKQSVHVEQIAAIFSLAQEWGTDLEVIKNFVAPPGIQGLYWIMGYLGRKALVEGKAGYKTLGIAQPARPEKYCTPWQYFKQFNY